MPQHYLHRLGFVLKRPKKRLAKADADRRAEFVSLYAKLRTQAKVRRARIVFVDEAHLRADADPRGKWGLRGEPALVDSSSPRLGEKVSYYSAVCHETGEVEQMEPEGNCTAKASADFLRQLRANHPQPLIVIWDNAPAHRGEAIRQFLATPEARLQLVALPAYSPDFNADEMIWDWLREEVTANTCLGTKVRVEGKMGRSFQRMADRTDEVKRRCRTALQAQADALTTIGTQAVQPPKHVDLTLGSVWARKDV